MPKLFDLFSRRIQARKQQIRENLQAMASVIDQAQKEVLNVPYPPASRPGEAPRRRTGRLREESGVQVNLDTGTIQLVDTAPYAVYLKPTRPWQDLALQRAKPQLDDLRKRKMPFGSSS